MRPIYTLDLETDPFEYGKIVQPFVSGIYDGSKFISLWDNEKCIDKTLPILEELPPGVVYAHNGGKFDFFYFLKYFTGNLRIINGRIVSATLGKHEFRDSYAIMPFPLREYKKDDFDYELLRAAVRELHRERIISYLRNDCVYLHELCTAFFEEFGDRLTIGGSSLAQLKKHHKFEIGGPRYDLELRKEFYFGGRNQCFQTGVIKQKCEILDVNSMYPDVMRNCLHPVGNRIIVSKRVEPNTCFVTAEGHNYGAFPVRSKTGGLDFTRDYGVFSTTIHEFKAALETSTFRVVKIKKTYGFDDRITFEEFIDHFYNQRKIFKASGDATRDLLYKFTLNSSYGKFAQNPANYFDWQITDTNTLLTEPCLHCRGTKECDIQCLSCALIRNGEHEPLCAFCDGSGFRWSIAEQSNGYLIWNAHITEHRFYNIAVGASITGAARAKLLRGIHQSVKPIYCDTDSIICESSRVKKDKDSLGAWKLEGTGSLAAVAGKKLYAIFADKEPPPPPPNKPPYEVVRINGVAHWCIKKAHKGARLTAAQILSVANGAEVEYKNPVPAYRMSGQHIFTKRRIKATV